MNRSATPSISNRVVFPKNRLRRKTNPRAKYEGTILDFSTGEELKKDDTQEPTSNKSKLVILDEEVVCRNRQLYEVVLGHELYQGKIIYNNERHIVIGSADRYISVKWVYEYCGKINQNFIVRKNITGIRRIDSLSNPSSLLLKKH